MQQENNTSRMAALLGRLRREMNGAVSESMTRAGLRGGLNYGVSIPTIRSIAEQLEPDHDFARFLYRQQVRELRLAALTIAEPERLEIDTLKEWLTEISQREVLDELALRLLSRAPQPILDHLARVWLSSDDAAACYTALMALNRSAVAHSELWPSIPELLIRFPERGPVARAALAFCSFHPEVVRLEELPATDSAELLREEFEALFGC